MSKKRPVDEDPLQGRVNALELQLEKTNELLRQTLAAMGMAQQDTAAPAEEIGEDRSWNEDLYYVRIKPHNPKRGHVRRRTLVPELGRPINGGTGKVGDIPEWIPVPRDKAIALTKYHQDDNDLDSPLVFDICTKRERELIDHREAQQRMAGLGMAGMPPAEVLRQQPLLQAKVRPLPSTVTDAERFDSRARQGQMAPVVSPAPPVQAGRRKALEGLDSVPPPPPAPTAVERPAGRPRMSKTGYNPDAVAEDLSFQAAGHGELDAAIEAASQLSSEPMGRITPA